jgi:hypothetical protein
MHSESETTAFYADRIRQSYLAYYIENVKDMTPLGTREYTVEVLCVAAGRGIKYRPVLPCEILGSHSGVAKDGGVVIFRRAGNYVSFNMGARKLGSSVSSLWGSFGLR